MRLFCLHHHGSPLHECHVESPSDLAYAIDAGACQYDWFTLGPIRRRVVGCPLLGDVGVHRHHFTLAHLEISRMTYA